MTSPVYSVKWITIFVERTAVLIKPIAIPLDMVFRQIYKIYYELNIIDNCWSNINTPILTQQGC